MEAWLFGTYTRILLARGRRLSQEVKKVLSDSEQFRDIELLLAIPEHKVALPGG